MAHLRGWANVEGLKTKNRRRKNVQNYFIFHGGFNFRRMCRAAELAILTAGRIRWAGLEHAATGRLDEMTVTPDDNIKAHFDK